MTMILQEWLKIMIKFIKNYGVYIAEIISAILLLIIIYYALWFICLIDDACYQLNFMELV
jgi:hypothetical protein